LDGVTLQTLLERQAEITAPVRYYI